MYSHAIDSAVNNKRKVNTYICVYRLNNLRFRNRPVSVFKNE